MMTEDPLHGTAAQPPSPKEQWDRAAEITRKLHAEFGEEQTRLIRHAFMVYFGTLGWPGSDDFDQNVFREACFP